MAENKLPLFLFVRLSSVRGFCVHLQIGFKNTIRLKKNQKIVGILVIVLLSLLYTAVTDQVVPTIFIGNVQVEIFLLLVCYLLLFSLLFRFFFKYWKRMAIILCVVPLVFPLLGIGWNYPTTWRNFSGGFTHARNRFSSEIGIKSAKGVMRPHISLQQRIQQKVDHTDPEVRTFAVKHSLRYFDEYYAKYGQICRQFSLIRYIKENFKYVKDPAGFDYFASPTESIALMAGDCDDYSILMASALEAIGVKIRIIWAPNHVYPELYCGDRNAFDKYVSAVYAMFGDEIGDKRIYYRLDKEGNYWMNIDYTDAYPGSVYLLEEVLSIIYIK